MRHGLSDFRPQPSSSSRPHSWDVVGARAAGLSVVWIDRLERTWPFPTDEPPSASTLVEAVELALARPV